MDGKPNAMVGDAPLRKVVSPDLFRTVAGANHDPAAMFALLAGFFLRVIKKFGAQQFHSPDPIMQLGALFLAGDNQAGWDVGDPDGGADFIDVLSAGSA